MRPGAHVLPNTLDSGELARKVRQLGYSAAYCPPVELSDTAKLKAIRDAYSKEGLLLAEVGAWCNMRTRR